MGEFLDLIPLIDWCGKIGIEIIQLLPLNDNGNGSSPYSSLSAFALNPIHLSLHSLPEWTSISALGPLYQELQNLLSHQRVDYEAVRRLKNQFLKLYFLHQGSAILGSQKYAAFANEQSWLMPFSLFKALKFKTEWSSWLNWPKEWKPTAKGLNDALLRENQEEVNFHAFVQFLCYEQLSSVKRYANQRHVFLKGDIPILIDKESADVWANNDIFYLNYSAGAPPDMYSPDGQDWGFPIYNWDALAQQDYKWWTDRLNTASHYYDLFRLDHIVGFYRIWAIGLGSSLGHSGFFPKDREEWVQHGEKIMRALVSHCSMLPIGEDLGTVPNEVRHNLASLGICGTKVIRWERLWEGNKQFIPFNTYEPLSMTTVSTHDSETLQLWWTQQIEEAKEFSRFMGWPYSPKLSIDRHREMLYDSHHTSSLFHINLLQEYLALFPDMTWPNPEEERINVPGTVSDKNGATDTSRRLKKLSLILNLAKKSKK